MTEHNTEKTVCPFCSSEWVTAAQHDRNVDRVEQEAYWERVARIKEEMLKVAYEENKLLKDHPPQRKPLTGEEIEMLWPLRPTDEIVAFARAIEAAHGIKENT